MPSYRRGKGMVLQSCGSHLLLYLSPKHSLTGIRVNWLNAGPDLELYRPKG